MTVVSADPTEEHIYWVRGENVMLDSDLAALYGIATGALNQAVKRHRWRFPPDFMFQLSAQETAALTQRTAASLRQGRGHHRKYRPYVFTELGAGMLASVLRHPAATVSVEILRAFARLRTDPQVELEPDSSERRVARSIFAAVRDACLLQRGDESYTTDVPCTYFVQAGEDGPIKIGATKNLAVRLRTLCAMSPVPLRLLGLMKGNVEERCHLLLGASRLHGEWFAPTTAVLQFIQENAVTPAISVTPDRPTRIERQ